MRKIAYKGKRLIAQAQRALLAQPQARLVAGGMFHRQIILIKYGKLYKWDDIDFEKELIEGMHIPSDSEWTTLTDYIDTNYNTGEDDFGVGNHLKHRRQVNSPLGGEWDTEDHPRWDEHDPSSGDTAYGRDTVRFSALPSSATWRLDTGGGFPNIGGGGGWWSSTEFASNDSFAWNRYMEHDDDGVNRNAYNKNIGFSLRCVREATASEQTMNDGQHVRQLEDYDGNRYDLIKIGTQVWTRQNIATTHYTDGTEVTCYDYDNDDSYTFFDNAGESIWK